MIRVNWNKLAQTENVNSQVYYVARVCCLTLLSFLVGLVTVRGLESPSRCSKRGQVSLSEYDYVIIYWAYRCECDICSSAICLRLMSTSEDSTMSVSFRWCSSLPLSLSEIPSLLGGISITVVCWRYESMSSP